MSKQPDLEVNMKFISVKQYAKMMQISEKMVRRMLERGELRSKRVGRLIRIPESELEMETQVVPMRRWP
jgi:excisionase family DNA binding protein